MNTDIARAEEETAEGKNPTPEELAVLLAEFENGLSVPADKRTPRILVCPVGLVGAGKSTVIKPLSEKLSLLRISSDEFRHLLKDRGFGYRVVNQAMLSLLKKYLALGYSIALDADCAGSAKEFIDRVPQTYPDLKVVWLHIDPPESFILDKLRNYRHTWLFADADEAVANYFRRKPLHAHLDMPFLYTFDTSRSDLDRQIDEAVGLIGKLR